MVAAFLDDQAQQEESIGMFGPALQDLPVNCGGLLEIAGAMRGKSLFQQCGWIHVRGKLAGLGRGKKRIASGRRRECKEQGAVLA